MIHRLTRASSQAQGGTMRFLTGVFALAIGASGVAWGGGPEPKNIFAADALRLAQGGGARPDGP
jgi:hypothetical protein